IWSVYYACANKTEALMDSKGFHLEPVSRFFFLVYKELQPRYQKFECDDYHAKSSHAYLNGILWCSEMYRTGKCPQYDYVYEWDAPHPYSLLLHLHLTHPLSTPRSDVCPVPPDIYPIMVLPFKALNLIPAKYHPIVQTDLRYIYEMEECRLCQSIHRDLSQIQKKLREVRTLKQDDSVLKKDYGKKTKELANHKVVHKLSWG